jgi:LuxR family maltose regulon positive regulatory protein
MLIKVPRPRGPLRDPKALTKKEKEVADLLAKGKSGPEIAKATGLTYGTTRVYLHAIYKKIGVRNRTEAALRIARLNKKEKDG